MKCKICSEQTQELLKLWKPRHFLGFQRTRLVQTAYCRSHLISAFEEIVLGLAHPTIFFHPDLDGKHGAYQYVHVPLTKWHDRQCTDETGRLTIVLQTLEAAFSKIRGACACGTPADSAYFPSGSFQWAAGDSYLGSQLEQPEIDTVTEPPQVFCRSCALQKVTPPLLNWSGTFGDGLVGPMNARGVYWATQV